MRRRPRGFDDYWDGSARGIEVIEDGDPEWAESGVLGPDGGMIMVRVREEKWPIGYTWHDENGELRPKEWFFREATGGGDD